MNNKKHLYTAAELFRIVMKQLKEEGRIPENLLEYANATGEKHEFRDYAFDVLGTVNYGASEGIYVDIFYRGDIGDGAKAGYPPRHTGQIGTLKTLYKSDDDFRRMAKLMADFQIAANKFIQGHLNEFTWTGYDIDYYAGDPPERLYGTTCKGFIKTMDNAATHALKTMARLNEPACSAIITENATGKTQKITLCPHCMGGKCELSFDDSVECLGSEAERNNCSY